MSVPTSTDLPIALERIDVGGNVRELNSEHVDALAGSIAVIGPAEPIDCPARGRTLRVGGRLSPPRRLHQAQPGGSAG